MLTHSISTSGQFALVMCSLARLAAMGVALPGIAFDLLCALTVFTTGFATAEVAPPAGSTADELGAVLDEALAWATEAERVQLERLLVPMHADGWDRADQFEVVLDALIAGWQM